MKQLHYSQFILSNIISKILNTKNVPFQSIRVCRFLRIPQINGIQTRGRDNSGELFNVYIVKLWSVSNK